MPFKSEAQRRFMFSQHPDIARRWVSEGKGYVDKEKGSGTTFEDNKPVGTAGQPMYEKMTQAKKNKAGAISRRMKKKQDEAKGKKN